MYAEIEKNNFSSINSVFSGISNPVDITKTLGGEAKFFWNTTTGASILEAKWGLFDGSGVFPVFIIVNTKKPGVIQYNPSLNTSQASRYRNRVDFIGNISAGQAWFVLTNLLANDTNEYAANIKESGVAFKLLRVKLTVKCKCDKVDQVSRIV